MKKHGMIFGSIIIAFIILLCILLLKNYYGDSDTKYYIDKFKKNRESFENVAEICKDLYNEKNATEIRIFFDYSSGEKQVNMYWDNVELTNQFEILNITDDIKKDMENIEDSFSDLYWDGIFITANQIVFTTEGNKYSIACSISGNRPKYIRNSNEGFSTKAKSICDSWYILIA